MGRFFSNTIKEFAISHKNKPDEAYDKINEIIKKEIIEIVIKPISEKMDPLIGSQSNFQLESLDRLEHELTELILDPLVEQVPSIFNNILADPKYKTKEDVANLFNKTDIASSLLNYFSDFEICLLSVIAIYLWPFVPTGNVFNNWLNIAMILNFPFLIWSRKIQNSSNNRYI